MDFPFYLKPPIFFPFLRKMRIDERPSRGAISRSIDQLFGSFWLFSRKTAKKIPKRGLNFLPTWTEIKKTDFPLFTNDDRVQVDGKGCYRLVVIDWSTANGASSMTIFFVPNVTTDRSLSNGKRGESSTETFQRRR